MFEKRILDHKPVQAFYRTYRVDQKSKPLPNDQKIVLNRIKNLSMRLELFVILQYESNTIILFVGIRYSMRDLLSDLNNYA